jgi:uncharacterized membrane protein
MSRFTVLFVVLALGACSGDDGDAPADARIIHGCPSLVEPQAMPGDAIDGDTWDTYARQFFVDWCTRCHSVDNVTPDERTNAPDGYNWDDEASVLEHVSEIRNAVGVVNFMPFNPPDPTCDDRQRIVRWIDAGHPGLP